VRSERSPYDAPVDAADAQRFAEEWYAAWNAHDLDAVLEHYADDVEMTSPLVAGLAGAADGRIIGKEALRAYFTAGLERFPDLRFEPLGIFVGVDSLVLHYISVNGRPSAEVIFLDAHRKVARYFAHYTDAG
jgi:ketosteroid isomerase-like protein